MKTTPDREVSRGRSAARGLAALCALFLLASSPARAQTINDEGFWASLFAQGDFLSDGSQKHKLLWWFDGQARFLDDADFFTQGVVRPGLGWSLTDNSEIWAGYAWIRTVPVLGPQQFDENRIWQQWTWGRSWEPLTFSLRTRLEERFVETGSDTGVRFRQFMRAQHNVPRLPRFSLVCWDEIFFNLNDTDWGAQSGLDQNRVFAGFACTRDPDSRYRIEIGYLNQSIWLSGGGTISNHILSFNLFRSR